MLYHFYILRCTDNSLYCGMTTDLQRRVKEHNAKGTKSAKYLRGKTPVVLIYSEEYEDMQSALKREAEVKKWSKARKEDLVTA